MFLLFLNPMDHHTEAFRCVAKAQTREALQAFMDRERLPEPVKGDDGYFRTFREGPLHWFNARNFNGETIVDAGEPPPPSPDGNYPTVTERNKWESWEKPLQMVPEVKP